jgi:succinate dehydrogenase / fumarate reductase flavoprotein subunit
VACVSVHGANRLGANALVEARVFGRRAGLHAAMEVNSAPDLSSPPLRSRGEARVSATMSSIINGRSNSSLKAQMAMDASLFPNRDREGLMSALNRLSSFEYANAEPLTNSDRLLHELCKLTTQSALFRRESRGAHIRSDYPAKSSGLPVHTVARLGEDGEGHISSRPVRVTRWPIYGPRVRGEAGSWVAEARSPDESRSQQWMKR